MTIIKIAWGDNIQEECQKLNVKWRQIQQTSPIVLYDRIITNLILRVPCLLPTPIT